MAHQVPNTEPDSLRVGDSWAWRREDLSDYPASTWTLTYYLRNATGFIDIVAAADGEVFEIAVPAATTASYTAGDYNWSAMVSDGTDRYEVGTGAIVVTPDVSAAAALDLRTDAQVMLDAVNAALLNKATAKQLDLVASAVGGLSQSRDPRILLELQSKLELQVKREQGTGGYMKRINVHFT